MTECDHVSVVREEVWEKTPDGKDVVPRVILWGCTRCDATSPIGFFETEKEAIDHTKCGGPDVCFGCKAQGLQLNPGDASRDIPDKKWTSELKAYKKAREQGIQPAGTTRAHVQAAVEASETLGKAYNSETMPKAKDITAKSVEVMKEIGQI